MADINAAIEADPSKYDVPSEFKECVSQLASKVKELGEANPDKIYEFKPGTKNGCFNTENVEQGRKACIVGQAIGELYPKLYEALRVDEDDAGASPYGGYSAEGIMFRLYYEKDQYEYENEDFRFIRDAQMKQDRGSNWGTCVA